MPLQAGFAQVDITPPLGTVKIGWIKTIISDRLLDPLFARLAVFENGGQRVGFIQLDTLFITADQTAEVRRRIERAHGFPGASIMVSASHNHAGPAIDDLGDVHHDPSYVASLLEKVVGGFGQALANRRPAELGMGHAFEFGVCHNRRIVMRDGTVRTHGTFNDPNALCFEGPVDPELAVVAARGLDGKLLGAMVNFACHPTQHGGDTCLSAGFPGVLADRMKEAGCPVTLFLNGACGNLHAADPSKGGAEKPMEELGGILAEGAKGVLATMEFRAEVAIGSRGRVVQLPFRRFDEAEVKGASHGAQRFVDPTAYDRGMPELLAEIKRLGTQPAEVQVVSLGSWRLAAIPAEYFVQLGLRVKEEAFPAHALVVSCANGSVGYVPHREAFRRGGYETTFCSWSKLAPEAGDLLADAAAELIRREA